MILCSSLDTLLLHHLADLCRRAIERLDEVETEGNEAVIALAIVIEKLGNGHVIIDAATLEHMAGRVLRRAVDRETESIHYQVMPKGWKEPS